MMYKCLNSVLTPGISNNNDMMDKLFWDENACAITKSVIHFVIRVATTKNVYAQNTQPETRERETDIA